MEEEIQVKLPELEEIIRLLSQAYVSTQDLKILAGCDYPTALSMKKSIKKKLTKEGKYCPATNVPTWEALDYLNINLEKLQEQYICVSNLKDYSILKENV